MKRVAVFGKPGSGKSTLSKALSAATGIPLYPLDAIAYNKDGQRADRKSFDEAHESILSSESWIIDGFGPLASFNQRLEAADTLVYIDLPYLTSYQKRDTKKGTEGINFDQFWLLVKKYSLRPLFQSSPFPVPLFPLFQWAIRIDWQAISLKTGWSKAFGRGLFPANNWNFNPVLSCPPSGREWFETLPG